MKAKVLLTICKYSTWCLVAANTTIRDSGFITCFKRHNNAADLSSDRQHANASFNCSGSFDSTSNLKWLQYIPLPTSSCLILYIGQSVCKFSTGRSPTATRTEIFAVYSTLSSHWHSHRIVEYICFQLHTLTSSSSRIWHYNYFHYSWHYGCYHYNGWGYAVL